MSKDFMLCVLFSCSARVFPRHQTNFFSLDVSVCCDIWGELKPFLHVVGDFWARRTRRGLQRRKCCQEEHSGSRCIGCVALMDIHHVEWSWETPKALNAAGKTCQIHPTTSHINTHTHRYTKHSWISDGSVILLSPLRWRWSKCLCLLLSDLSQCHDACLTLGERNCLCVMSPCPVWNFPVDVI